MKAKTKTKYIMVLNAILGVVFAFIMGVTYCVSTISRNESTHPTYTSAYLANKNNYKIINSTTTAPIVFGQGSHNVKLALDYVLDYDFDVRVEYSLSWDTQGKDTSNVILNYAGRDRFIVDKNYIYLKDTVEAGRGTLNIINSVSFVDPTDETYIGETLTITATVLINEVTDYSDGLASSELDGKTDTSAHPFFVSDSIASESWIKLKSGVKASETNADVIVYNYRFNTNRGIKYPEDVTAYSGSTPLYGNRYYSGAGIYVMTGNSDVTITLKSSGSWQKTDPDTTDQAYDNNILYNFNSVWGSVTYSEITTENVSVWSNSGTAKLTISANSQVYLNLFDSIEITSILTNKLSSINYENYRMVSTFTLNGVGCGSKEIDLIQISGTDGTNRYTPKEYELINTSLYNPYLYDASNKQQLNYALDLSLTNNTAETKTFEVNYSVRSTRSNGKQSLLRIGANGETLPSFEDSENWSISQKLTGSNQISVKLAPYSTASLVDIIAFTNATVEDSYDDWVDAVASVSNGSTASSRATVETKVNGGNLDVYIRNNSNKIVTISKDSINGIKFKNLNISYGSALTSEEPADFKTNYWRYYQEDVSGNMIPATKSTGWTSGVFFYRTENYVTDSSKSISIENDLKLAPNSVVYVGSIVNDNNYFVQGYVNSTEVVGGVGFVQNGENSTYFVNASSTSSYYIRFTGTISGTNNKILTTNGYNYYIGIIRPNQMLDLSVTSVGTMEYIEVTETYEKEDFSSWNLGENSSVYTAFDTYFSID